MKKKDLKKMDTEGLKELVSLKKSELLELRLNLSKNQSEGDVRNIRRAKKELAQFLTIIKKKESDVK